MLKKLYTQHRLFGTLMITAYTIGILPVSFSTSCSNESILASETLIMNKQLSSLSKADAWINSKPLTPSDLEGKVVLVEFCTYTCINWLRTMPYIRAWSEKYKQKGLVVIGVHTPEFPFEKNLDNIRQSIAAMQIDIPIAVDNNYNIWNAFNNQYWPALYFIDAKGRIRHTKFGEGDYDQSESAIQQLLKEAGNNINFELSVINGAGVEAAPDWSNLRSQENYLGYQRTENFSSMNSVEDKPHNYEVPGRLPVNHWALSGEWIIKRVSVVLNKPTGKIVYRFHARDMHAVLGTISPGSSVSFRLLIDGSAPGEDHGIDVDANGYGIIREQRLYQLIRQRGPVTDREVEIQFLDPGVEGFSFTFG